MRSIQNAIITKNAEQISSIIQDFTKNASVFYKKKRDLAQNIIDHSNQIFNKKALIDLTNGLSLYSSKLCLMNTCKSLINNENVYLISYCGDDHSTLCSTNIIVVDLNGIGFPRLIMEGTPQALLL